MNRAYISARELALFLTTFCGSWFVQAAAAPSNGFLDGSFKISKNGGANYSIPLTLPPGTQGLAPSLSLYYDSQAQNGTVGMGWAVTGASTITRCGATYATDGFSGGVNFDASDRFCIDGARLINTGGSGVDYYSDGAIYHTEVESWKRIVGQGTCGSGPCSFTVQYPDGRVANFGSTQDSQFLALDASGSDKFTGDLDESIRAWGIDSITDVNGNYMTFTYSDVPVDETLTPIDSAASLGANYLLRIDYTFNDAAKLVAQRSVQFAYETRSDISTSFQGGARVTVGARVSSIASCISEAGIAESACSSRSESITMVSEYKLAYCDDVGNCSNEGSSTGRSLLATVTQCDGDSATCREPTNLSWQTGSNTLTAVNGLGDNANAQLNSGLTTCPSAVGVAWVDFNGDGLLDWVCSDYDDSGIVKVLTSSVSAKSGQQITPASGADQDTGVLQDVTATCGSNGLVVWADFSASGRVDWLCNADDGSFYIWASTGSTLTPLGSADSINGQLLTDSGEPLEALCPSVDGIQWADINGDGYTDWLCTDSGDQFNVYALLSDGKSLSTSSGIEPASLDDIDPITISPECSTDDPVEWLDFNGDGAVDWSCTSVGNHTVFVFLSEIDEKGQIMLSSASSDEGGMVNDNAMCPSDESIVSWVDLNGDGLLDWACLSSTTFEVSTLLSSGASLAAPDGSGDASASQDLECSDDPASTWRDFNGDGNDDWVCYSNGTLRPWLSDGVAFYDPTNGDGLSIPVSCDLDESSVFWGDFNGDLMLDWICNQIPSDDGDQGVVKILTKAKPFPDLVRIIEDGRGGRIQARYSSLTDPSVYSQPATNAYPQGGVLGFPQRYLRERVPFYVVREYSYQGSDETNGIVTESGGSYDYRYDLHYTNGVVNLNGRGWQGFQTQTIFDRPVDNALSMTFLQAFPWSGKVDRLAVCAANSASTQCSSPLIEANVRYQCGAGTCQADQEKVFRPLGSDVEVYQVVISGRSVSHSSFGFVFEQEYQFDQYGNAIVSSNLGDTAQPGGKAAFRCTQYINDTDSWRIGLTRQVVAVSDASRCPVSDDQWSDFAFSIDYGDLSWNQMYYDSSGNAVTQVGWDSMNSIWKGYAVQERDAVGNVIEIGATNSASQNPEIVENSSYLLGVETTFQTFYQQFTTPAANKNDASTALTFEQVTDARTGNVVASRGPDNVVQLRCANLSGTVALMQGPYPSGGGDPNCLSNALSIGGVFVGNDISAFASAPVATLNESALLAPASPGDNSTVSETLRSNWDNSFDESSVLWQTTQIDALQRPVSIARSIGNGETSVQDIAYISRKRPSSVSLPHFTSGDPAPSITVQYDEYGRKKSITYPSGEIPFAEPASMPCTTSDPSTSMTQCFTYDAGNTVTQTDAANSSLAWPTVSQFSFFGSTAQTYEVSRNGGDDVTTYARDAVGRLATVTDPLGGTLQIIRDSLGRSQSVQSNMGKSGSAQYNQLGQLVNLFNTEGTRFHRVFDGVGRIESVEVFPRAEDKDPTRTIEYAYDSPPTWAPATFKPDTDLLTGRLTGARTQFAGSAKSGAAYALGYDAYGNVNAKNIEIDDETYAYSIERGPQGEITQVTYPTKTSVTGTFDYWGDLSLKTSTLATGGNAQLLSAQLSNYNQLSEPQALLFGDGSRTSYTFDVIGRPTRLTVDTPTSSDSVLDLIYLRDSLGNVIGVDDCVSFTGGVNTPCDEPASIGISTNVMNRSERFSYEDQRLKSAQGTYGVVGYDYHSNGNLVTIGSTTYTYETTPQGQQTYRVETGSDGFSAQYTPTGSMSMRQGSDGSIMKFGYDALNRVVGIALNGQPVREYRYDPDGNRIRTITINGDGSVTTITEIDGLMTAISDGESDDEYVNLMALGGVVGVASTDGDTKYYLHRDAVKSSTLLASGIQKGQQVNVASQYRPFGQPVTGFGSDPVLNFHTFEGHAWDPELKLYDFGSRLYDPEIGRFISADSRLGGGLYEQDALNGYALEVNRPPGYFDPDGHIKKCNLFMAAATIGGAATGFGLSVGVNWGSGAGPQILDAFGNTATGTGIGALAGLACMKLTSDAAPTADVDFNAYVQTARNALDNVVDRYNEIDLDRNNLRAERDTLEGERDAAQGERDTARAQVNQLTGERNALEETLNTTRQQLDDVRGQLHEFQNTSFEDVPLGAPNTAEPADNGCVISSFETGTHVVLAGGEPRAIELVAVGDEVLSWDEETNTVVHSKVDATMQREVWELVTITLSSGQIVTTREHPFRVTNKGWLPAGSIVVGDRLETADDQLSIVMDIGLIKSSEPTTVFNLSIENSHTFFVSKQNVLVHNAGCSSGRELTGSTDAGASVDTVPAASDAGAADLATESAVEVAGGTTAEVAEVGAAEVAADIGVEILVDSVGALLLLL